MRDSCSLTPTPKTPRAEDRFKAVQQAYEILSNDNKRLEYDKRFRTSPMEDSSSPRTRGAGVKTAAGSAAQGTAERADRNRGPMFRLGYFLGIVLIALVIVLLILLILDIP